MDLEMWRIAIRAHLQTLSHEQLVEEASAVTEGIAQIVNVLRSLGFTVEVRDGRFN